VTDHPAAAAAIASDLSVFGGILRCGACKGERPLDDIAGYLSRGWPEHCGQTMTWVTLRELAAENREVPDGYELAAVPDDDWRLEAGKPCTRRLKGNRVCREPSAASLNRGRTARATSGTVTPAWWPHCASHLYGRWIENQQVMHWVLREVPRGTA